MRENLTIIEIKMKALRERIGYTQNELAQKLGVSRSLICLWEQGYANISLKQLIKISYIYQVPLDYLFGFIDKPYPEIKYNYIKDIDLKYIGKKIREIRKKENLTQDKFSKKLDTKRSSISYYEIGKMMMSSADLKQICEIFGVSADYIVGNTHTFIKRPKLKKIKPKDIKELVKN